MAKSLFTTAESTSLFLSAIAFAQDGDSEKYLAKIERILVDKMYESSEIERLLKLSPQ